MSHPPSIFATVFSYTIRELMRHVFAYYAPDDMVRSCSWYKEEGNKPGQITRRQRVSYMIHSGITPKKLSTLLRKDITDKAKEILNHVDDLSKYTHIEEQTFGIKAIEIKSKAKAVLTIKVI